MVDRLTWRMVKFTGLHGGAAFTDLADIAAILDTREPQPEGAQPQLAVVKGATIYLKSGRGFYVRETAETVFEELHRYRTEQQPAPPSTKLPDAAPSSTVGGESEEAGQQTHDG